MVREYNGSGSIAVGTTTAVDPGCSKYMHARLTAMEVALRAELHPSLEPTVEVPTPLSNRRGGTHRINIVHENYHRSRREKEDSETYLI